MQLFWGWRGGGVLLNSCLALDYLDFYPAWEDYKCQELHTPSVSIPHTV